MSEARTVWHDLAERRAGARHERFAGYVLAATILVTMATAEVQFLRFFAGPDSVSLIQAADGFIAPDQGN